MSNTPGTILKSERESRNLNIAQISKGTRIRAYYIEAMEADNFSLLPSPVQARGFLRAYAEFLRLDADDLLSKIEEFQKTTILNISESSGSINEKIKSIEVVSKEPLSQKNLTLSTIQQQIVMAPKETDREEEDNLLSSYNSELPNLQSDLIRNSHLIFARIGEQLKNQREALSLSLDEVEIHSHVRRHYLESIETGEFDKLPSTVQARGMLTNYARFLEIDLDEILLLYADGLQAQRFERQPLNDRTTKSTNPIKRLSLLQRYLTLDLVFGGGLVILLIVFAFWATGNVINLYKSPGSEATARSISDIILTPLQTLTIEGAVTAQPPIFLTNTPLMDVIPIPTIPGSGIGQVQVYIIVLQSAWMRVTVDRKIVFEGRVESGSAYPYNGNFQVEILTGNGSALQIIYNQKDLGVMGTFGEVINRIYTQNTILEPTGTITPIPTFTPTLTKTPRLTRTPLPTRTPYYPTP